MDENQFAARLAALKVKGHLPRDAQEQLFSDAVIASSVAEFLHDHHPKTMHPSKPAIVA